MYWLAVDAFVADDPGSFYAIIPFDVEYAKKLQVYARKAAVLADDQGFVRCSYASPFSIVEAGKLVGTSQFCKALSFFGRADAFVLMKPAKLVLTQVMCGALDIQVHNCSWYGWMSGDGPRVDTISISFEDIRRLEEACG